MKKFLFGFIATVIFGFSGNAQSLEESAIIITNPRLIINSGGTTSAKNFTLKNFDSRFTPVASYNVDGYVYTDSGRQNDVRAGDGIYTSIDLFTNLLRPNAKSYIMKSDLCEFQRAVSQIISTSSDFITIGCKINHTFTGYSLLGFSCANGGGCIYLTDCYLEIGF